MFDVLVTMDQNLPHQQSLKDLDLAFVVISSISSAFIDVVPLMPEVNAAVLTTEAGAATFVAR